MLPAVNTLFNALAQHPHFARLDFSSCAFRNGGGMAVQKATAEAWLKVTGCPVVEGLRHGRDLAVAPPTGLTAREFTGTIGLPMPAPKSRSATTTGADLAVGAAGEICIRGPQVMAGYWERRTKPPKVMTADGFFKSGDIGIMDERGYTRIVDRKKDMILVSGFNVYPNEIEQVISMHPGVLECAAVGVADEKRERRSSCSW